jgi:hypothetical protein
LRAPLFLRERAVPFEDNFAVHWCRSSFCN